MTSRNHVADMTIEQRRDDFIGIAALRLFATFCRQPSTQTGIIMQTPEGARQRGGVHGRDDQGRITVLVATRWAIDVPGSSHSNDMAFLRFSKKVVYVQ